MMKIVMYVLTSQSHTEQQYNKSVKEHFQNNMAVTFTLNGVPLKSIIASAPKQSDEFPIPQIFPLPNCPPLFAVAKVRSSGITVSERSINRIFLKPIEADKCPDVSVNYIVIFVKGLIPINIYQKCD